MNLIPEKYDIIFNSLISFLAEIEEFGDYALQTIKNEYLPAIKISEQNNLPPFDEMLYILADKFNFQVNDPDPILGACLTTMLLSKLGLWKKIIDQYRIV